MEQEGGGRAVSLILELDIHPHLSSDIGAADSQAFWLKDLGHRRPWFSSLHTADRGASRSL